MRAEYLALIAAMLNGTIGVFTRFGLQAGLTPSVLAFYKCFIAFIIIAIYCLSKPKLRIECRTLSRYWHHYALLSFFGIFCLYFFETWAFSVDVPEPTTPDMEIVLEAGDVLYIPRGWWHNPVPMGCETFHLAIGTFAPTGYDYMQWLAKQTPNILPLRYNLSDWESDKDNIIQACNELSAIMTDPVVYDKFMQEHMANYRSDSAFNMQLFGNANADANDIPDDALIISNIVDGRTLEKGYVIANGLKININDDSQYLLKQIMQYEPISLCNLLQVTDNSISNDVRLAIAKMAELDIIELIL